jgi:PHD/YefM family antitoxin component YafN of YafNO toxin-antitoxin module
MEAEVFSEKQYKEFTKELIRSFEKRKIIPLNTLKNDHYILEKPLYITLEIGERVVIASLDDIEAFSYADTEYEAINQLSEEIVNLYKDLKEDRKSLEPLPKKWLAFLEEVIRER